ncbi:MAG: hypothetical protein JWQ30_1669 [Sediminibacterium sp.]|nr:hypothetical protein [Sediminibacterium sp.]
MKSSTNYHLILSVILIIPIALVYGLYPEKILPRLFDFTITGTDLSNIFRAIMGLYLAMAIFWMIGIVRPKFWKAATIANIIFMGGLASGRMISLLMDGMPSIYFLLGLVVELLLAGWGIKNLRRHERVV